MGRCVNAPGWDNVMLRLSALLENLGATKGFATRWQRCFFDRRHVCLLSVGLPGRALMFRDEPECIPGTATIAVDKALYASAPD